MILPRQLTSHSAVHIIYPSSPVEKADRASFAQAKEKLTQLFPATTDFPVEHTPTDPWYLVGSEHARLSQLRAALRGVGWLVPAHGGTGCADIVRRLTADDLKVIAEQRPVVSGFSDATFLLNFLYFKLGLLTFHYSTAAGLFEYRNHQTFLDVLQGKVSQLEFAHDDYRWISQAVPPQPIAGIAVGGNWSTLRDLLDICRIEPPTWQPYLVFLEELGVDAEDLHRLLIPLDARGIFRHARAVVIGTIQEQSSPHQPLERPFESYLEALLEETVTARAADHDPLYILKVPNFGHGVRSEQLILPIGATCTLTPNRQIKFIGPFVA